MKYLITRIWLWLFGPRVGDTIIWNWDESRHTGIIVSLHQGFVRSDGVRRRAVIASVDVGNKSYFRCVRVDEYSKLRSAGQVRRVWVKK
jgi:hypothetical protein